MDRLFGPRESGPPAWGWGDLAGAFGDRPIFPTKLAVVEEEGHLLFLFAARRAEIPLKQRQILNQLAASDGVSVLAVAGRDGHRDGVLWVGRFGERSSGTQFKPGGSDTLRHEVMAWWLEARRNPRRKEQG